MKKPNFSKDILPHVIAVAAFFLITVFFFNPIFFKHQVLNQGDIQQWEGSSKALRDFREKTGEEGLWASTMFSGMPAYLVNVEWSNGIVTGIKQVLSLGLPHPVCNIFLAFLCYYLMLLSFGVRPYLAIAGAIAFGLSSYMIIGIGAGHNARIGAIAFMPLAIAGVHLAFSGKKVLGFGVTTLGFALHLRENHLQITYYLAMVIGVYILVQLVDAIRKKMVPDFFKTAVLLIPAIVIAAGTFFGQLWAITEYTAYSIRGKSTLTASGKDQNKSGLSRDYAFAYNYGLLEPITLLIPEFYGGSSMQAFVQDKNSESYRALAQSGDNQMANQLAGYTLHYWGPQTSGTAGPYYSGAIVVFLFIVGICFANRKYVWWLVPLSIFSLFFSWGESFSSFNYLMFDYLPGYNKFRSVNFALIIIITAMPLLGMIGLNNIITQGLNATTKKRLLIALYIAGGICILFLLFSGMMSFMKEGEGELPSWFTRALVSDRKSLLRADAFRSLIFILIAFGIIYFELWKKISPLLFGLVLALIVTIDLAAIDKRYFTSENFKRKREGSAMNITEADQEILKDTSYYRVFNLQGTMAEAHTSYYHYSIGGYHGAKIRRYQDLYDSCITRQRNQLIKDVQGGKMNFEHYGVLNMLNIKYIVFGESKDNIIPNPAYNGSAWFVEEIIKVQSPDEELATVCEIDTQTKAVVDASEFSVTGIQPDSTASITLIGHEPNHLKYESQSTATGLAVFSEIYYPKGWIATIDGKESEIIRADYVLRALYLPPGKHTVEFRFHPDAYFVGNKITMASSWLMLLVVLGSFGWSFKKSEKHLH